MCALSRSERCANCWSMTSRSAISPLRSSSSSASATESLIPARSTAIEILIPNMPNRSSSAARVAASTGSALSSAHEAVHRQHRLGQLGGVDPGQLLQRDELALPQRARGQRQQPGHRDDGLADAGLVHLGGEPGGDVLGRQHGVDAAGADLVGPGRDADHAERAGRPADQLADLLEQRDVGGVERAQQEHHRVHARHPVLGHQQPQRPLRTRRATATTCPGCR